MYDLLTVKTTRPFIATTACVKHHAANWMCAYAYPLAEVDKIVCMQKTVKDCISVYLESLFSSLVFLLSLDYQGTCISIECFTSTIVDKSFSYEARISIGQILT